MFFVPKPSLMTTVGLIGVLSVLSTTVPALAAGKQTLEAAERATREREARRACLTGDYVKGVGILADLFLDTKNPTYLFNQGRCFEQNRQYPEAIARFQEFLRANASTELDPGDRAAAERHISDCKSVLAEERDETAAPARSPEPATTPELAGEVGSSPASQTELTEDPPGSGKGLRIGGIVTASVGLAAVATGVIFNLKANSAAKELKDVGGYSPGKESDRRTYKTAAWIGYGAGAACLVTGVVLAIIGYQQTDNTSSNVALVPMVSQGQAGVAFSGGF